MEKSVLSAYLKEINDDDLKTMFKSSVVSYIENQSDVEEKLIAYLNWDVPVHIGDIVEYEDKKYYVTCVYTDNSVDLLGENANKKNIGLYMKTVKVTGKLQVIKED